MKKLLITILFLGAFVPVYARTTEQVPMVACEHSVKIEWDHWQCMNGEQYAKYQEEKAVQWEIDKAAMDAVAKKVLLWGAGIIAAIVVIFIVLQILAS